MSAALTGGRSFLDRLFLSVMKDDIKTSKTSAHSSLNSKQRDEPFDGTLGAFQAGNPIMRIVN